MTLAGLRADLLLFGPVLAHPRRHWTRWHALVRDLFGCGGATIDTPPAEGDEAVWARTVIQPDGDVLVLVHGDHLNDVDVLAAHQLRVGAWYEQGRATVDQALLVLRVLVWATAAAAAAVLGSVTSVLFSWAVGLVVGGVVLPLARGLFSLVAKRVLQGRIDRVLEQVGVAD